MRRSLSVLLVTLFLLLGSLALATTASAATLGATTSCSNSVDDTPGLGLICQVAITNVITASGGFAHVVVRECHGAAGNPKASCRTTTSNLSTPVTRVTQCNSSINGGGGTLRCSVTITNDLVNLGSGSSAPSVDQCVGSGGGITVGCDPFPAATTGAAITQCNGSANGGTLVGLRCTVTGTASATGRVKINQCNGSANGGGALVICSASVASRALATVPVLATIPPTATAPDPAPVVPDSGPNVLEIVGLFVVTIGVCAWSMRSAKAR